MGISHTGKSPRGWLPKITAGSAAVVVIGLLFVTYFVLLEYSRPHVSGDALTYSEFVDMVEHDRVLDAEILDSDGYVIGHYRAPNGSRRTFSTPYFKTEVLRENLTALLIPNRVKTVIDQQQAKSFIGPLLILIPALILVVVFAYFIISYRSGTGFFSIGAARKIGTRDTGVTFTDVAGQDAAVEELREVAQFLADPARFTALGSKMPRGVLLFGPPGTGKTLLARALAGESGAAFYSISGADFVEMYVGLGAARVRELFKQARADAPAIIFIDELDAVAGRRVSATSVEVSTGSEQEQTLNQILSEMDGFSASEGIVVLAATNRPDTIDPALLRPGRFDRTVGLELPGEEARRAILAVHARGRPLGPDVDLDEIAERAVAMTGADLAIILNDAGIVAVRAGRTVILQADLLAALAHIMEAPERQRRLSMRDRTVGRGALAADRVSFDDVAGADEAIEELEEIRDYLGAPDRYADVGARIPRGFLISGPPGTGKTMLARAVAGESNATFIAVAGTDFVQRYVGEGAARVRDLFAEARAKAPAILFIDELDAIGEARGSVLNDHTERYQTLNQILVELDGFSPRAGVVVIGATNRPGALDAALVRPGRFDREIVLDLPDAAARQAILEIHARGKPIAPGVKLDALARLTRGMAGADLANVMNEASLLAARRRTGQVTMALLEEATERAWHGVGSRQRMTDDDRRAVAYHEAGHALVALSVGAGTILHRISILSRGRTLGAVVALEAEERYAHPRSVLIAWMAVVLGGRAAEELVFGEPWDGVASDFERVATIARGMVARLGMSDRVGPINHAAETGPDGSPLHSEQTARVIDEEVRKLVDEAAALARNALARRRGDLDLLADALLERETLTLAEVEEILGPAGAPAA